jgi:hypothetical protein
VTPQLLPPHHDAIWVITTARIPALASCTTCRRSVATLWYGPKSDCPPTEIAPLDVPASSEAAGRESEPPFTTEVAALLNVPLNIIYKWHKEGTGPPGYQTHKESQYRRSDVVRWLASKESHWRFARANAVGPTREPRSRR